MWSKTKTSGKAGFDKVWGWADKLGAPVNRLSNKLGSEAFWPTTMDKESDKAARILRSFCKDGFYEEVMTQPADGPKQKQKVLKRIPMEVIKNAKGLVIFTTMRTGLWVSGAGGSGVIVARLPDGSWSPPSGILLHTAGLGFLVGVDIYDCVMVLNTTEAVAGFSQLRCTVGGEISAVAGPVGIGGVLESEVHKRQAPIFTYLKSRGFYAGVQVDGTIIIERTDENEKFYGERLSVGDILAGKARHPPREINTLIETIRAAQGDTNLNQSLLTQDLAPSDFEIDDGHLFGVPEKEDPDPYGVLALEKQGVEIREAGTKTRASHDSFIFNPSPSSPVFGAFNRQSIDGRFGSPRSSWRASVTSIVERYSISVDMATQTDFDVPTTPKSIATEATKGTEEPEVDEAETSTPQPGVKRQETAATVTGWESDDDAEEAVIHEVKQAASPRVITKARLVTVEKRPPPPPALPPRNPVRDRKGGLRITAESIRGPPIMTDQATSPLVGNFGPDLTEGESATSEEEVHSIREEYGRMGLGGFVQVHSNGNSDGKERPLSATQVPLPPSPPRTPRRSVQT
ncbi:DUF500-domain-containing protein [Trichodelitschia bisporula]|uniref:DUF500-domain-containing protein n=1 Tax=Trichodelitschia bisporula TaxID=703511 RepID=A0A6G1I0Q2_9PEZI|nr:DUF500-domain-containing protein [Trichodelitschia bisporula]